MIVDGWKWTLDSEEFFQKLKKVLARLPVLTKVCPGDTMYLYYAVSDYAVNSVLLKEDEGEYKGQSLHEQGSKGSGAKVSRGREEGLGGCMCGSETVPLFLGTSCSGSDK